MNGKLRVIVNNKIKHGLYGTEHKRLRGRTWKPASGLPAAGHKKTRLAAGFGTTFRKAPAGSGLELSSVFDPDQLDAAVQSPTFFSAVVGNRLGLSVAFGDQAVGHAFRFQVVRHRLRTALRQPQVVGILAFAAGVALDFNVVFLRMRDQVLGDAVENDPGIRRQLGRVMLKMLAFQHQPDRTAVLVDGGALEGAGALVQRIDHAVAVRVEDLRGGGHRDRPFDFFGRFRLVAERHDKADVDHHVMEFVGAGLDLGIEVVVVAVAHIAAQQEVVVQLVGETGTGFADNRGAAVGGSAGVHAAGADHRIRREFIADKIILDVRRAAGQAPGAVGAAEFLDRSLSARR